MSFNVSDIIECDSSLLTLLTNKLPDMLWIKDLDGKPASIHFLTFGFLAFSISWFLYTFEIGVFFKIISAILSLIFIWGIVLFSFNRCEKRVPWFFIIAGFLLHSLIQGYLTYTNNFTAVTLKCCDYSFHFSDYYLSFF